MQGENSLEALRGEALRCGSHSLTCQHTTPAFNQPREDERLSWPCWLTYSRRLTHKVIIHPAISQAQDRESSPVKNQRSTTVLLRQNHNTLQEYLYGQTLQSSEWPVANVKKLTFRKYMHSLCAILLHI